MSSAAHYEKDLFPVFNQLFVVPSPSSPLRHFARDPQEALFVVILENQAEKPVTAWRFWWQFADALGRQRSGTMSGDSYAVDCQHLQLLVLALEFILLVVGTNLMSIVIAIALFGSRGPDPKNTANLVQTFDELLKKNQQLMKRNQHLLGEIGSLRSDPLNSHIPVKQVQTLDHLTPQKPAVAKRESGDSERSCRGPNQASRT